MSLLCLLPAILGLLLLVAHFMRLGVPALMAVPIVVLALLVWPRPWVARLAQLGLLLGSFEWLRATFAYVSARQALGLPWTRLLLILGGVALFTLISALVFQTRTLRRRYRLD